MPADRPFQSYLVERMQYELEQRAAEYLEDRVRTHSRFVAFVTKMHEELFMYRTTSAARNHLSAVDAMVTKLKLEEEELRRFKSSWRR